MQEDEMMYKPIFDYELIKKLIERQNPRVEVVKVAYLDMPSWDSQTFLVLEWFNGREFAIRRYYSFLQPSSTDGRRQPLSGGSGSYPQLFDRHKDLEKALELFFDDVEELSA